MDIIMKLDESGQLSAMSLAALKEKVDTQNEIQSFFTFMDGIIADLNKANRFGTARSYGCLKGVLKSYCNEKDLKFQDVTYQFLTQFETNHISKGNSPNGCAVYMRTIRAIYNKAIKEGFVEKELYPFGSYKIKTIPTEKRALEWDLLKKIIELKIPSDHECHNARNYFVASYMMYGMNFTDMAFLKVTDIKDGRILYRRKKTSKLYDIKLTKSLEKILRHYMKGKNELGYIFPIIHREDDAMQYKDIQWAQKRYNTKLKLLAKQCKIDKNLTSYVSRHSFATQAMLQEIPLNAISTMLGHSSLKTTEVYLKSLPSNILDDYNAKIMGM
jgi:site-specific recombinase XerD